MSSTPEQAVAVSAAACLHWHAILPGKPRKLLSRFQQRTAVQKILKFEFHQMLQTLLLAKSIVVALLGDDNALPRHKVDGKQGSGLLFLFFPIVLGAVASTIQSYTARTVLASRYLGHE